MNNAQQALTLLRNEVRGDDLHQMTDVELHQLQTICEHWQAMATSERTRRTNNVLKGGVTS